MPKSKENVDNSGSSGGSKQSKAQIGMTGIRSPSLESTASIATGAIGRFTSGRTSADTLENSTVTAFGNLFDSVSVIIWCPKHKKIALRPINQSKGLWLPFTAVRTGQGWHECSIGLLKDALKVNSTSGKSYLSFSPPELVNILRVQVPVYYEFITRVVFITELTHDSKHPTNCCENSKIVNWFSNEELAAKALWGPEPQLFADAILAKQIHKVGNYIEFTIRDALRYAPKEPPKSYQEELVKSGGFSEKDIFKVFSEYLQHSFPAQYMSVSSFEDYMTKVNLPEPTKGQTDVDLMAIFRAFAFNSAKYLSFNEFLLGLCAMDRNVEHGGHTGELRSSYIFRYYNKSGDNQRLDYEDMKSLTKDILKLKNTFSDEKQLESEVKSMYQSIGIGFKDSIDMNLFIRSIGQKKLKGTSVLFRSQCPPLQRIRTKRYYQSIVLTEIQTAIEAKAQKVKGTCLRCRDKKYTLAAHTVRLSKEGWIVDPQENKLPDVKKMPKPMRQMSDKCFLGATTANAILDVLRAFANSGAVPGLSTNTGVSTGAQTDESTTLWGNKNSRIGLVDKINKLLTEAKDIIKKESRVVKVCSPVFVLGDIHGNFKDLVIYERSLWKMGPTCVAPNFLFLGDYVDRGVHSVECILYLLCNKVLSPEKYWLLRGNHELRGVQLAFTFKTECTNKFGSSHGQQLWEAFNKVFDYLPISAVIDESIFCAHGGIPTSTTRIEELLKIPAPMDDPENQSQNAWQILWNDPVTNQEFLDYKELLKTSNSQGNAFLQNYPGFLPNTKRGTAYYFSEEALKRFLSANQLSHVIRAHEVIPNGYAFHMGGKCITIFSSSKYCGGLNESACILVNDEKIRVIKIDTT